MKKRLKIFYDIGRVLNNLNMISTTRDLTAFIYITVERIDLW